MPNDKYLESIRFIESLLNLPGPNYLKENEKIDRSFFIKRLQFLLNILGNPEKDFKYIHIAGTSGKSSLTCMLQSILTEAKITAGAYFSPHPTETFERIKVGNHYISKLDFAKLTDFLKPYLSKCAEKSPYGVPSYFETLLALALLYFKQQKREYVALETGMGGTFDATNIIPECEVAIITKVDLDHTDILGNTKEKIARDKAGIIKKNSILITGEQNPKILKIFQKICKQKKCEFRKVEFDYEIIKNDLTGTKFKYQGQAYRTKLPGEHQIQNAILTIKAIQALSNSSIKQSNIIKGLSRAFLPCRLEIIKRHATVILDGAHNPDKMKSTAEFIKSLRHPGKLHLVLALAENKDLYNTIKHIVPLASHLYFTRFLIPGRKSQDLKKMYQVSKRLTNKKVEIHVDPWQALDKTLHKAKKNDIVLVTGSFFLAGELKKQWLHK